MNPTSNFVSIVRARHTVVLAAFLFATFVGLRQAKGDSVTVVSSTAVTYLDSGLGSTDFASAFTPANFTAAQTGTAASKLASTPSYVSSLSSAPSAVWIGTNTSAGTGVGDTALYAISFDVPTTVTSASLDLFFAVDNILGLTNPGIYINGTALPNSTALVCSLCTSSFTQQNSYSDPSIGSLLVDGTNWIYFDAVNQGGPAGLIFSATIDYTPTGQTQMSPVPEPSSLVLLGSGLVGLLGYRLRRAS